MGAQVIMGYVKDEDAILEVGSPAERRQFLRPFVRARHVAGAGGQDRVHAALSTRSS